MAEIISRPVLKTFDNGLTLITQEMYPAAVTYIKIFVHAGGNHDFKGKKGLAHLVEHMMLIRMEGSKGLTLLDEFYNSDGSYHGPSGQTNVDHTSYDNKFFSDDRLIQAKNFLTSFFWIIKNGYVDDYAFSQEKKQIVHEMLLRKEDGYSCLYDSFLAQYYERDISFPVIGNVESIEQINPQDVRKFLNAYYRLDNIVVIISGDIPDVDNIMSDLSLSESSCIVVDAPSQPTQENFSLLIEDSHFLNKHVFIGYKFPQSGKNDYKYIAFFNEFMARNELELYKNMNYLYKRPSAGAYYFSDASWVMIYGSFVPQSGFDLKKEIVVFIEKKLFLLQIHEFMSIKEKALFFRGKDVTEEQITDFIGYDYLRTNKLLDYDDYADTVNKTDMREFREWATALFSGESILVEI